MPAIARKQREAIKRIFDRSPLVMRGSGPFRAGLDNVAGPLMTYREFRGTVQHGFDCLMVRWNGMWLGIEQDGYTHS